MGLAERSLILHFKWLMGLASISNGWWGLRAFEMADGACEHFKWLMGLASISNGWRGLRAIQMADGACEHFKWLTGLASISNGWWGLRAFQMAVGLEALMGLERYQIWNLVESWYKEDISCNRDHESFNLPGILESAFRLRPKTGQSHSMPRRRSCVQRGRRSPSREQRRSQLVASTEGRFWREVRTDPVADAWGETKSVCPAGIWLHSEFVYVFP